MGFTMFLIGMISVRQDSPPKHAVTGFCAGLDLILDSCTRGLQKRVPSPPRTSVLVVGRWWIPQPSIERSSFAQGPEVAPLKNEQDR